MLSLLTAWPLESCTNGTRAPVPGLAAEVQLVTPEQANAWLEETQANGMIGPRQRRIDPVQVQRLAHAIAALEWEPTMISLYEFEGRLYLVDGQHRLSAIVRAGMPAPLVVSRKRAETIGQVNAAYRRIDGHKPRSAAVGIVGGRVHEHVALGDRESKLGKFLGALKILMNGFANSTAVGNQWQYRDPDTLARGMYQWQEEARAYYDICDLAQGKHRGKMLASPVFAVALVTLRYCGAKTGTELPAEAFWESVARQESGHRTGPWHAAQVIDEAEMRYVSEVTRKVAACWNVYRQKNGTVLRIGRIETGLAIKLAGTIYRGGMEPVRETFGAD